MTTLSETIEVAATPEAVWALVSDLPGMGRLSPEATGGEWVKGATGPTVGAHFKGRNAAGSRSWSTLATVTESVPGEVFAFAVTHTGLPVATWRYALTPTDGGCTVTETWVDRRGALIKRMGALVTGVRDRETSNREGMRVTLQRVKAAVEA